MSSTERGRDGLAPETQDPSMGEGPALRDAAATAQRIARDEADAAGARERYRSDPLPAIEPDERIAPHLEPGDVLHTLRSSAILWKAGDETEHGYGGALYLTSRTLVHVGRETVIVKLTDIVESSLAGERLLLGLAGGDGIRLDVDRPRRFRTDLSAAVRRVRT